MQPRRAAATGAGTSSGGTTSSSPTRATSTPRCGRPVTGRSSVNGDLAVTTAGQSPRALKSARPPLAGASCPPARPRPPGGKEPDRYGGSDNALQTGVRRADISGDGADPARPPSANDAAQCGPAPGPARHSPMARSTSTATTATPAAPVSAPTRAPTADIVEQLPEHWIWTSARPMRPPQSPATTMTRNATARARTLGSAVGPPSGSLGSSGTVSDRRLHRGGRCAARPGTNRIRTVGRSGSRGT